MALCRSAALQALGQGLVGLGMQGLDDVAKAVRAVALAAQLHQLVLQGLQFGQALAHMAQMGIQGLVGCHAIGLARTIERQQGAHLVERHIHGPTQPDKAQAVHIAIGIEPVLVVLAHAGREQLLLLVIADIGRSDAGTLGRLANTPARNIVRIEGHA